MIDFMLHRHIGLFFLVCFAAGLLTFAADAFAAAPTFTAFSPTSGKLGTAVTLTGSNFVTPLTVTFNGVASTAVTVVSSTKATATVPPTASTGKITLKTSGGSVTGGSPFTVVPGLVTSASGTPTETQMSHFSGFGAFEAVDYYFDTENIALASASSSGAGSLLLTIPADARPGTHWITAVGRHTGYSGQVSFLVRTNWTQFGFGPYHQSNNVYENVLDRDAAADLREAWRTPAIRSVLSTPAIFGGVVYATFGDGTIRAFDEMTGTQKWSFATGGGAMRSSPAVSGGVVYAGSTDKYLYALDAATGKQKWRYQTGDVIYGSPTVGGGLVYFGSVDKNVYALNAATGNFVWNYVTGDGIYSTPAVAKGVVYVTSADKNVYAFNAATGLLLWQVATGGSITASPVLVGGLVCVGASDANMYAFEASTGNVKWTYAAGGAIEGTAAVMGTTLFFGANDASVYSVSAGGLLRWSTRVANVAFQGSACIADGVLYDAAGSDMYALATNTGEVLTTLPEGNIYGGPVVVNGAVLVGSFNDGVLARYAPNAAQSDFVAPRPDPSLLTPRPLR